MVTTLCFNNVLKDYFPEPWHLFEQKFTVKCFSGDVFGGMTFTSGWIVQRRFRLIW